MPSSSAHQRLRRATLLPPSKRKHRIAQFHGLERLSFRRKLDALAEILLAAQENHAVSKCQPETLGPHKADVLCEGDLRVHPPFGNASEERW